MNTDTFLFKEIDVLLRGLGIPYFDVHISRESMKHVSTPAGVLRKIIYTFDGEDYYLKSGEISNSRINIIFPVTEIIASEIGQLLGFDVVKYHLCEIPAINFLNEEEFDLYKKIGHNPSYSPIQRYLHHRGTTLACMSKSFTGDCTFMTGTQFLDDAPGDIMYSQLVSGEVMDRKFIDNMIIFDFLICNVDRHTSNFGTLTDELGREFGAPLYDHGQSLLSTFSVEDLNHGGSDLYDSVYLKPFGKLAFTRVDWKLLKDLNVDVSPAQICSIVDRYAPLMNDMRRKWIHKLLTDRWQFIVNRILSEGV